MRNNNSTAVSCGIGFPGALFICFLVLKLTHVIDWSWWWITAPLWAEALIVIFVLVIMTALVIVAGIKEIWDR